MHPFVLFVLPAECNLTGTVYPVQALCAGAKRAGGVLPRDHGGGASRRPARHVLTLVDAAKAAATRPVDLAAAPAADAVAVSFYKLFGYPTGLGALLLSRRSPAVRALLYPPPPPPPPAGYKVTSGVSRAAARRSRPSRTRVAAAAAAARRAMAAMPPRVASRSSPAGTAATPR